MTETVVVILIVLAAVVGVVWNVRRKLSTKGGCCGCDSCESPPADQGDT